MHGEGYCQIATTSTGLVSLSDCKGPYDAGNTQALKGDITCFPGEWNKGCFIREPGKMYKTLNRKY